MNTRRVNFKRARRILTAAVITTSPLCAGGCMVGPSYAPPATPMPSAYSEAANGATTAGTPTETRWWRQFDDPELADLVERSVSANYEIAVAEARLREARASREAAQSLLYPQVSVGASALRFRGSDAAIGIPGFGQDRNLFQVGFDASWVVDIFGGTRRGVEAARANEQATAADRRGVVLMVAAETARAYLELRGAQRQLQIAQQTLQEQRQTLAVTEDKHKNGLSSDLEVLRARTEVESTAAEIPPIQQAIRQYIHVISTLLGLAPTALSPELEVPAAIPAASGPATIGIPSELLRRRPDIQATERQLAAATAQVGVAVSTLFPQLVLGGSGGFASRDFDDLFNGNTSRNSSSYYVAGPAVNWTIFDAGRRKAGVKIAEARVDAANAAYEDTVLRALREVESALVAVDRAHVRVADLKRLAASARESATIARRDYQRGILDQLTVLDAQRQADRADMLLAQGEVAVVVNMVTLYKALGGGWEIAEASPASQPTAPATQPATPINQGNKP